jgi:hypothetical protein
LPFQVTLQVSLEILDAQAFARQPLLRLVGGSQAVAVTEPVSGFLQLGVADGQSCVAGGLQHQFFGQGFEQQRPQPALAAERQQEVGQRQRHACRGDEWRLWLPHEGAFAGLYQGESGCRGTLAFSKGAIFAAGRAGWPAVAFIDWRARR